MSDTELHETLNTASVVVVASFDEGLSLPVIEAINCGANVVAADIPAHRELIGKGSYLVDPRSIRQLARAVRKYSGSRRGFTRQQAKLAEHRHGDLERVIAERTLARLGTSVVALPAERIHLAGSNLKVALATPYPPQKSGIADFSGAIADELNDLCDLTLFTTSGARVPDHIKHASIDSVIAQGSAGGGDFDSFVTVLGNSHFHVPFLEVMKSIDTVAVLHDTRMVELYMAMRGIGGVEQVMTRGSDQRVLVPSLTEQIDDMRLLQNMGFWEIAQRARALIMHSPSAAPRIEQETGIRPFVLEFANQRVPRTSEVTSQMRRDARDRLGFKAGHVHIASFGYVDVRTKMVDVVVEAVAWLATWGHPVSLHLAGSASPDMAEMLTRRAVSADLAGFEITGFLGEEQFRDYLLAVDLGVQLRVSPMLGVSGPLSDLAAFGTPSLASRGLAIDVGAPDYVDRLPDEVSPVLLAEAIEHRLAHPADRAVIEAQRLEYLDRKSPRRYAETLLAVLTSLQH
jgi:glycosyltransferase involved in cell wall biosynthesis